MVFMVMPTIMVGSPWPLVSSRVAVRYMLAADLAQRLHRHSDTSPIRHLLLRWNRPLVSLRRVGHDVQLLFKAAFKLPSKAAWTLFASWDHFAIACLKSETPMATEIQAYLLDAGVAAAANVIAEQETGHDLESKDKREFLDALSPDIGIPISELIQVVKGGDPSTQGTWAQTWPRPLLRRRGVWPARPLLTPGLYLPTLARGACAPVGAARE
jgi:hypothetical protein